MNSKKYDLSHVDNSINDLRRGTTVFVNDLKRCFAVMSVEMLTQESLDAFSISAKGNFQLLVTGNRLNALGVDMSPQHAYSVAYPGRLNLELISFLTNPLMSVTPKSAFEEHLQNLDIKEADYFLQSCLNLSKLARLLPAVVVAEMPNMGSLSCVDPDLINAYASDAANALTLVSEGRVPLESVENAKVLAFRPQCGGVEHLAIVIGDIDTKLPVLIRLHSECFTGDLLGSLRCDCGSQLRGAIDVMSKNGSGILLYLAQEGRGIGLVNKLRAYQLQDVGHDTVDANLQLGFDSDERNYSPAVAMLRLLGVSRVKLMTNNPSKVKALSAWGVEVTERVAHAYPANPHNKQYLQTKVEKSGHIISI
jgi:GTP cyclohydrolase II